MTEHQFERDDLFRLHLIGDGNPVPPEDFSLHTDIPNFLRDHAAFASRIENNALLPWGRPTEDVAIFGLEAEYAPVVPGMIVYAYRFIRPETPEPKPRIKQDGDGEQSDEYQIRSNFEVAVGPTIRTMEGLGLLSTSDPSTRILLDEDWYIEGVLIAVRRPMSYHLVDGWDMVWDLTGLK